MPRTLTLVVGVNPKDARSPLASPRIPKGEANAKGEDSLTLRYRKSKIQNCLTHSAKIILSAA
ncbi:hypothetical protein [Nostoc sp.]|uniref:hypothetical protein n=1 Tax=Nostoc sp. TaxID=1180 RepID=UPI002FEEC65F